MSTETPPLLPGRVQAVRAWDLIPEVGTDRVHLGSLAHRLIWPRGTLTAECVGGGHIGPSSPPGPGCDCGIYGWHPLEFSHAWMKEGEEMEQVAGVIDAWGRIEVHETGIRAEHARIAALLVDADAPDDLLEKAERAAATYGVELLRLTPDAFLHHVAILVNGLDESFVEGLLCADRRLCFEPRSVAYLSRRGEAVGGFGFVEPPEGEHPKRFQKAMRTGLLGTQIIRVAGAKYHADSLQVDEVAPGRALALIPEPDNPRDPRAISVWDAGRTTKVGYVPRDLAEEVAARLAAGRIQAVRSIWQWRDLRTGRRTGLHMLLAATPTVEFVGGEQLEIESAA